MTEGDWSELSEAVNNIYDGFSEKLYSLYNMSDQDYHVNKRSLLIN